MKHPVHQKIKSLIAFEGKSREEIAEKLDMTTRTLIRRLENGMWTLPEIVLLEEIFGTSILTASEKYFQNPEPTLLEQNGHNYTARAGYKINILIDPDEFNPQDFDQLQKELTEKMLLDFKKKQ